MLISTFQKRSAKAESEPAMKNLILNKISQRSTWVALGAAGVFVVTRFAPEYLDMYVGILTALGLIVNDKKGG